MVVLLRREMRKERIEASRLFLQNLHDSQISDLGYFFLRDIYFGRLLDCRYFFCNIFLSEDSRVVGFVTYSTDTSKLFAELASKCFLAVILSCIKGFLLNPLSILRGVLKYITFVFYKKDEPASEIKAEVLSLAISTGYQKDTNTRVSDVLYKSVFKNLYKMKVFKVRTIAAADNFMSKILNRYFKMDLVYSGKIKSRGRDIYSVFVGDTNLSIKENYGDR